VQIKETLKKACKIIVLVTLVVAISMEAPFLHRDYIRHVAEQSSVQIYGQQGTGTGIHVQLPNGKVVLLTNNHICDMGPILDVESEGSKTLFKSHVIKQSTKHDLCVMEAVPGAKGIKLGNEAKIGDILFTLGHPRGEALNVSVGEYFSNKIISMIEILKENQKCNGELGLIPITTPQGFKILQACRVLKPTMQLSSPTYPGNSGSAVVNKYGHLVGLIFAGNKDIENQGFAVPLSYIKEFLSSI